VIDLFPRDEEIESGVQLLKVGILSHLRMNVLHVGSILELGDLDPEFFIAGKLNGRREASPTKLGSYLSDGEARRTSTRHPRTAS